MRNTVTNQSHSVKFSHVYSRYYVELQNKNHKSVETCLTYVMETRNNQSSVSRLDFQLKTGISHRGFQETVNSWKEILVCSCFYFTVVSYNFNSVKNLKMHLLKLIHKTILKGFGLCKDFLFFEKRKACHRMLLNCTIWGFPEGRLWP